MLDLRSFRQWYAIRSKTRVPTADLRPEDELTFVYEQGCDLLAVALGSIGVDLDWDQAIDVRILIGDRLTNRQIQDAIQSDAVTVSISLLQEMRMAHAGLVIDAELASRLPLVPLAESIASVATGGRLIVKLTPEGSMGRLAGLFSAYRIGWTVLLDAGLPDRAMTEAFAHELAHALDPSNTSTFHTDTAGYEAFAESLAPMLLDHRPTSVLEAAPLVQAALQTTCSRRRTAPSSDSLEDVLEWALEEVGALRPEPELIAAYTTNDRSPKETH